MRLDSTGLATVERGALQCYKLLRKRRLKEPLLA